MAATTLCTPEMAEEISSRISQLPKELKLSDRTVLMQPVLPGERKAAIRRLKSRLTTPVLAQTNSPLFTKLPPELRNSIFDLVLTSVPELRVRAARGDPVRPCRPRRTPAGRRNLLETCRAVYHEAWYMMPGFPEETFYFACAPTKPPGFEVLVALRYMTSLLETFWVLQDQTESRPTLSLTEPQLSTPGLNPAESHLAASATCLLPRTVSFTLRHIDGWFWEDDYPLCIDGMWTYVIGRVIPPCVEEVRVTLETLYRKRHQVKAVAQHMSENWYLKRSDGVVLYADVTGAANIVENYSLSSVWGGYRWVSDEAQPGALDFHRVTVLFRREEVVNAKGGEIMLSAKLLAQMNLADPMRLFAHQFGESQRSIDPFLRVGNHPADEEAFVHPGEETNNTEQVEDGNSGGDDHTNEDEEDELNNIEWTPVSVAEAAAELGSDFYQVYESRRNWTGGMDHRNVYWG